MTRNIKKRKNLCQDAFLMSYSLLLSSEMMVKKQIIIQIITCKKYFIFNDHHHSYIQLSKNHFQKRDH